LNAQGLDIQKKDILLTEAIKTLGTFKVPIQLHPEVRPEITVNVIAEE
jgi:large subunit ribosomal protein L9